MWAPNQSHELLWLVRLLIYIYLLTIYYSLFELCHSGSIYASSTNAANAIQDVYMHLLPMPPTPFRKYICIFYQRRQRYSGSIYASSTNAANEQYIMIFTFYSCNKQNCKRTKIARKHTYTHTYTQKHMVG